MKNSIIKFCYLIFCYLIFFNAYGIEQFNFDVTELEILENGDKVVGSKRGKITSNNGIVITADQFEYYKKKNILNASGNVKITDTNNNYDIYTQKITYKKKNNLIFTNNGSKAVDSKAGVEINAENFEYNLLENILTATNNAIIENKLKDYKISSNFISYLKYDRKIYTKGKTTAIIKSKYNFKSSDVTYLIDSQKLSSNKKTTIFDKLNLYKLSKFDYSVDKEELKGNKILISTNYNKPTNDKFYFDSGIINLKNLEFVGKNIKVEIHNDVFGNSENEPRLLGVSSSGNEIETIVKKGIFTSCKESDSCPPWSIQAEQIKHDKTQKKLIYDNAVLKVYDIPILYFPKFFHPDPTVVRQSGLLRPEINNSNILGSSVTLPYFKVISENKDLTFRPTIFDKNIYMSNIEYRQKNKNSGIEGDFGFVKNFKSSTLNKKKDLSHLFLTYEKNLNLNNYIASDIHLNIERISKDNYLKLFAPYITDSKTLRPKNFDKLSNNFNLYLNHEKFNLESGVEIYETLNTNKSDTYQFILPYYNLDLLISQNIFNGNFIFNSNGVNNLNETNKLETNIVNDLRYNTNDYISSLGLKSKFSIDLKNLNSIGKNTTKYKSSPQIELLGLFNAELSMPLIKTDTNYNNFLTPKISFRINPNDMKDYSDSNNKLNVDNIFSTNRLGLSDTFETGRSITLGLDFKKENLNNFSDINNIFEFQLATVLRDKEEKHISSKSTLNKKHSNIFGKIKNEFSENIQFNYNFSIDNDYSSFEYNDINATFSLNNIVTKFNFIEENDKIGQINTLSNSVSYKIDENNFFTFKTRRNRKINLTEYYDLVYEYKNDCLTAGIKYNKTYYSDGDLKPTENLLFTITLIPLTTYEYQASDMLQN